MTFIFFLLIFGGVMAQILKNLPAVWETHQSLGQEAPLEKEMATHSSILAWRIAGTGESQDRLQSMGLQGVGHD